MALDETAYMQGEQALARRIMGECLTVLGTEGNAERWRLERSSVVSLLRSVCAEHGDNDWPDNLHLRDVLEKHLFNHLDIEA
jgi:hypothetical protein